MMANPHSSDLPRQEWLAGLDVSEAVGAVDRPVHARLERHLRGVAALRTDDREILAHRPVIAALIAARSADLAHAIAAGLAHRSPGRSAARTALGIGREPLLRVELLVCRGVDELHAAVGAGQGAICIGHRGTSPGQRAICDLPAVLVTRAGNGKAEG